MTAPVLHYAGKVRELEPDRITELNVGGKVLCVLRRDDGIFAFAATCPHSGARFCEGWLDAQQRLVCPLHKYRFDPVNGRNTSGEGYKLKTFPVTLQGDDIFILF